MFCFHFELMSSYQIRTHIDPITKCKFYYTPRGRFIHTPPRCPCTDWANDFGRPWWKDESYCIGVLSAVTRRIRIINTLTSQEQAIEVLINTYCSIFVHPEGKGDLMWNNQLQFAHCTIFDKFEILIFIYYMKRPHFFQEECSKLRVQSI